ncbi:hypothetical protein [Streptomyces sp. NPDC005302]|uniref:hypothetical protein n=1 Tax=Streptomyces sp. NPDC005302 TaxID=3154675 RepID=UPI0033BC2D58
MSAQFVDRDGDTWTRDPESGEYFNRHVHSGRTLSELRTEWGPLSVREGDSGRLIPEEEHRTTSMIRRIIREELDRRFGPVTS